MLTRSICLVLIFCLLADPCVAGIRKFIKKRLRFPGMSSSGHSGSGWDMGNNGQSGSALSMVIGGVKLTNCNAYSTTAYGNKQEGYTCWKRQGERDRQCRENGNFDAPGGRYSFQRTSVIRCHCCLDYLGASAGYGNSLNTGARRGYGSTSGNYGSAEAGGYKNAGTSGYSNAGAGGPKSAGAGGYNNAGAGRPNNVGSPGYNNAGASGYNNAEAEDYEE